jgi:hypothetical protein
VCSPAIAADRRLRAATSRAATLVRSTTASRKLFALPDATIVLPAHDYNGRTSTTIGAESAAMRGSPAGRDDFIRLMAVAPAAPGLIDVAVPANRRLGSACRRPDVGRAGA